MRALVDSEIDAVAGGAHYDGTCSELGMECPVLQMEYAAGMWSGYNLYTTIYTDTIVVTAHPWPSDYNNWWGLAEAGYGSNPGQIGAPTAFNDPALNSGFPNVDMNEVRNVAAVLAQYISQLNPSLEHAAYIYADEMGNLRTGTYLNGDAQSASGTLDVYEGYKVIASIHNHPNGTIMPSTIANPGIDGGNDQQGSLDLISTGYAHENMLVYIIPGTTGDIYEYEAQDIREDNRNNIAN
jgi:hypothetical protein